MKAVLAIATSAMLMSTAPAVAQRKSAPPRGNPGAWISSDDYPSEAIRVGAEGRAIADLAVDSTGAISACSIVESSGNTALDDATCRIAMERGHFTPATDRKGRPIASSYKLPVRWTLPSVGPVPSTIIPPHVKVVSEVFVNAEGVVASCKVVERVGIPKTADPCQENKPGSDLQVIAKDGRPVSYKIVKHMEWDTIIGD